MCHDCPRLDVPVKRERCCGDDAKAYLAQMEQEMIFLGAEGAHAQLQALSAFYDAAPKKDYRVADFLVRGRNRHERRANSARSK